MGKDTRNGEGSKVVGSVVRIGIMLALVVAACKKEEDPAAKALQQEIVQGKAEEAKVYLKKLSDGAREYYLDGAGQFPGSNVGPTPPLGTCCKHGGKCLAQESWWKHVTWESLDFAMEDDHYYSYEYKTDDPARRFTVHAYGDLDCDGTYSTFTFNVEATPGEAEIAPGEVQVENALE